jgi:VWFA-related protein
VVKENFHSADNKRLRRATEITKFANSCPIRTLRSVLKRTSGIVAIISLLANVALLAAPLHVQQNQTQQRPSQSPLDVLSSPALQSRTDLVLVPVVVRDKKGKHLSGLDKDAFQLEENGKGQLISLFEEVRPPANDAPPVREADGAYSNLPFDNARQLRLTIIVLDLLNTSALQRTDGKEALAKFLSKGLAQNQPVSLLCLTMRGLQLIHPFSTDTDALIGALKKFPPGAERIIPRQEAARQTLKQLRQIGQAYAGIPGRKTLILAAGNIPDPQLEGAAYDNRFATLDSFQQTWNDLINANIAVYPIQLMAWAVRPGSRNIRPASGEATLQEFAAATGGNRCVEENDLTGCLADSVEDSRSYYMLGFNVRPDDRKPGWRNLKVKISVDHVDIRARRPRTTQKLARWLRRSPTGLFKCLFECCRQPPLRL